VQEIYNCKLETNHVSRVYNVAALLYLQSVLHVILFLPQNTFCNFYISTFRAVPNMAIFRSSSILYFPGIRYCLNYFEIVQSHYYYYSFVVVANFTERGTEITMPTVG
jgi:hypothetical protein